MGEPRPLRETIAPGGPPVGRSDPVIGALIDKLPVTGDTWSIEQRLVWLRMVTMAFDLAYGIDAPIEIRLAGVPIIMASDAGDARPAPVARETAPAANHGPRLGKKREADQRYVICLDGMAWDREKLLTPDRVGNGDIIWDFRPGEQSLDSVVWGDGEKREAHALPPLQIFKG